MLSQVLLEHLPGPRLIDWLSPVQLAVLRGLHIAKSEVLMLRLIAMVAVAWAFRTYVWNPAMKFVEEHKKLLFEVDQQMKKLKTLEDEVIALKALLEGRQATVQVITQDKQARRPLQERCRSCGAIERLEEHDCWVRKKRLTCNICGKRGHIAAVCHARSRAPPKIQDLTQVEEELSRLTKLREELQDAEAINQASEDMWIETIRRITMEVLKTLKTQQVKRGIGTYQEQEVRLKEDSKSTPEEARRSLKIEDN